MCPETKNITDEELCGVVGGYAEVNAWVNYLSTQIMPVIYGLANGASSKDRTILENICGTLRRTAAQGAAIEETVTGLVTVYNASYRTEIESSKIQATLDQVLHNVNQYTQMHI